MTSRWGVCRNRCTPPIAMIPSTGEAKGSNAAGHVIRGGHSRILPPGRGPSGGRTSEADDDAPARVRSQAGTAVFDGLFKRHGGANAWSLPKRAESVDDPTGTPNGDRVHRVGRVATHSPSVPALNAPMTRTIGTAPTTRPGMRELAVLRSYTRARSVPHFGLNPASGTEIRREVASTDLPGSPLPSNGQLPPNCRRPR